MLSTPQMMLDLKDQPLSHPDLTKIRFNAVKVGNLGSGTVFEIVGVDTA